VQSLRAEPYEALYRCLSARHRAFFVRKKSCQDKILCFPAPVSGIQAVDPAVEDFLTLNLKLRCSSKKSPNDKSYINTKASIIKLTFIRLARSRNLISFFSRECGEFEYNQKFVGHLKKIVLIKVSTHLRAIIEHLNLAIFSIGDD